MSQLDSEITAAFPEETEEPQEDAEAPAPTESEAAAPDPQAQAITSFGGQLLAGKYKTAEELAAGYEELRSKMEEQGNELGQWRQWGQQVQAQQQAQPQQATDMTQVDQVIDQNPAGVAVWAAQNGREDIYQRAISALSDIEPAQAMDIHARKVASEERAQLVQALTPILAPLHQDRERQALHGAWANVRSRLPEFDNYQEAMIQAAEKAPHLLMPIENGAPAAKEQAIESLYWMARGLAQGQPAPGTPMGAQPAPGTPMGSPAPPAVATATQMGPTSPSKPVSPFTQAVWDLYDSADDGRV